MHEKDVLSGRFIAAGAFVFGLIHLYAGYAPSSWNWGFHALGFFPDSVKILVPLLMIAIASFPQISSTVVARLAGVDEAFSRKTRGERRAVFLILLVATGFLFWIGRERTFLLGDGNIIIRTIRILQSVDDIPRLFPHEPLAGLMLWKISSLFSMELSEEAPVQIVNTLCGIGSIYFLALFARDAVEEHVDRWVLFAFVALSGGIQLCFGYVESYPFLYCAVALYLWLGTAALKMKLHPIFPSAAYGILFALHLGTVVLFPSLIVLWSTVHRTRGRLDVFVSVCSTLLVASALLVVVCGYSPETLFATFFKSQSHLLHPGRPATDSQAYAFFSLAHLLDFVNLQVLLAPFALLILVLVGMRRRWKAIAKDRTALFLLVAAAGGLGFAMMFNFDLGMSRDWDLLASFHIALLGAAGYGWIQFRDDKAFSRRVLATVGCIVFLHSTCWVMVNANETRSVTRFATLPDPFLWGRRPILAAYEELGVYYRTNQDTGNAIRWYNKFIAIDSTNPRIWTSVAYIYRLAGDKDNELRYTEKALELGASFWDTYRNLGMLYLERGRMAEALDNFGKALELNPSSAEVEYYLGVTLVEAKHDYRTASRHFVRSLDLGPNNPDALFAAGICCKQLGEQDKMQKYFMHYLELDPSSQRAAVVRQLANVSR